MAINKNSLDFFTPIVSCEAFHKNFKEVLKEGKEVECELFNDWAKGFVDRDNKIIKEFQTTFNSSFWEIYLYRVLVDIGGVIDWSKSAPDFYINASGVEFVIEATTASAAAGKPNEWDKNYSEEELAGIKRFKKLNTEAMIRLSNVIVKKCKKFKESYSKLEHVKGKPFVLAVAPFEQPHFNLQYDRAIRALLYDYYVDEDAFLDDPEKFPNGPSVVKLGFVEKDNGSDVPLGIFNDEGMIEVSALIFSCTATWGKLSAMCDASDRITKVMSVWATPPDGLPEVRVLSPEEHGEIVADGLQVYHNPYAQHPLPPSVFDMPRVVQHYFDEDKDAWVFQGGTDALQTRTTFSLLVKPEESMKPEGWFGG